MKILFPTDFSNTDKSVLDYACKMAKSHDASLLILHVEEPPAAYGGGEMYYGLPEPDLEMIRGMLHDIVPTDTSVACEHRLVTGDPATEIVSIANEEDVEMIVLGTHGRTGLSRLLMGSVAEAVVRRATCPVLTIKNTHLNQTAS